MNFKDELIRDIENARDFRASKAQQYPWDTRNAQSADALAGLLEYIKEMPESHRM